MPLHNKDFLNNENRYINKITFFSSTTAKKHQRLLFFLAEVIFFALPIPREQQWLNFLQTKALMRPLLNTGFTHIAILHRSLTPSEQSRYFDLMPKDF